MGSPKPFNFYQEINGIIFPDGFATPFALFSFDERGISGVYYPLDSAQGRGIQILYDSTVRPVKFLSKITGKIDSQPIDRPVIDVFISGDIFPSDLDSSSYKYQFSGQISGDAIDRPVITVPISGILTGEPKDTYSFVVNCSGFPTGALNDRINPKFYYSGSISGDSIDRPLFNLSFYGQFYKNQRDTIGIDLSLTGITYQRGQKQLNQSLSDTGNIDFFMQTISYSFQGNQ